MDESTSIVIALLVGVVIGVVSVLVVIMILERVTRNRRLREEEGRERRIREIHQTNKIEGHKTYRCFWCRDQVVYEAKFGWAMCDSPDHGLGLVPTRIIGVNLDGAP